jgi:choline dehydrogenase
MTTSLSILLSFLQCICAVYAASSDSCPPPYEYIVVGSGPGGGPLAARLAIAGHKTLLIDAGSDDGALEQYQVPLMYSFAPEVPQMNWNFYIKQYENDTIAQAAQKSVYKTPDGGQYVGLTPPPGSVYQGIW